MFNEKRCLTLPNLISFARICFIPPFVACLIQVQHHNFYRYIALGILVLIGLSDVLDGYLARKRERKHFKVYKEMSHICFIN